MTKQKRSKTKVLLLFISLVFISGVFYCYKSIDKIVKTAILKFAPDITGTTVALQTVKIVPFTGWVSVSGFELGNPKGFPKGSSFKLAKASLSLNVRSIFSQKVILKKVEIKAPEIFLIGSPTANNLTQIQKNVQQKSQSKSSNSTTSQATKKIELDDFWLKEAKVHVNTGLLKDVTLELPEIHITGIGKGPEGATPSEVANQIVGRITSDVARLLFQNMKVPAQVLNNVRKDVQKAIASPLKNLPIKGLFK